MNKNREILLMDKGFMISVVETLKTLDVRGYESNEKLVGITHDLQQAIMTKLPFNMVPNQEDGKEQAAASEVPEK